MRKILFLLAMVLAPLSASAMKPMSEADLSLVACRSGVSFFVDMTMDIHIDVLAWGDSDGLAPGPYNPWNISTSGGYVGVGGYTVTGLAIRPYIAAPLSTYVVSPNSVSFWPEAISIDMHDGVPYYRVHAGPGSF